VDHEGQTVWIEAGVRSPEGIPADWLEPPQLSVRRQCLTSRCFFAAIADKQKKFAEYLEKGVVGPNDRTVVAVNICRLSDRDVDGNGISRLPLAVEAVFPIGPLAVPISRAGKQDGPARNIPRFSVKKQSGREVETFRFLDPIFANVSAVMQAHQKDLHEKQLVLSTIHNPLAANQLPIGLLGGRKEFVAKADGDGFN
jgi:type I restriction enzyme S subunit